MDKKIGVKFCWVLLLVVFCLGTIAFQAQATMLAVYRPDGDVSVNWSAVLNANDMYNCQAVDEETFLGNSNYPPDTSDYIYATAGNLATDIYTVAGVTIPSSPVWVSIYIYADLGAEDVIEASYSLDNGSNWTLANEFSPVTGHTGWFSATWQEDTTGYGLDCQIKLDRTTADEESEADIYTTYMVISDIDIGEPISFVTVYLDPNVLVSNSGWLKNSTYSSFVNIVDDDPFRYPTTADLYFIYSMDPGYGSEIHTIVYGFENTSYDSIKTTLWFAGKGAEPVYPLQITLSDGNDFTCNWSASMIASTFQWYALDTGTVSLNSDDLNDLTVQIKRNVQSVPDRAQAQISQFYLELLCPQYN